MTNAAAARPSYRAAFETPSFPFGRSRSRTSQWMLASAAALLLWSSFTMHAGTWNLPGNGTWNAAANWNPASIPGGVGATAIFNGAATGSNPAQTANRTVTLDGPRTVGSIMFNNDLSTFTDSLTTGASGSLTFDEAGAGPATITVPAAGGTGNNTISVAITLNDSLVATVNNTTASSSAGALALAATMSGPGGFTKLGDGLASLTTNAKTYGGATVLSGGRLRVSSAAQPSATSSFTINPGGQLTAISAASYTFGSGPLNLNGAGPTTGPFAGFPGALRNDTNLGVTNNNAVVLQSDTLIHVQGSASGVIALPNTVSGPGKLTLTSQSHDANLGILLLNGANTYSGGTIVDGGTLVVSGAGATLGTGNVTVHSANLSFSGSSAKLMIQAGVVNAIADTAVLSLAGGNILATPDDGCVDLGAGVNEVVGVLLLGGVAQQPGTYGSTSSAATFKSNEFFSGTGTITVPPPPVLPPPVLKIALNPPKVVVSWPTNAAGFVLQGVNTLTGAWASNTTAVVVSGTNNTVTEGATNANKFFRLKR